MKKEFFSGILAGVLVSIGGAVFLSCENRYVGALLFSVALVCICLKGYALFTGQVGYLPEKFGKGAVSSLMLVLLGNFVGTLACGFALRYALPALGLAAATACAARLSQDPAQTLIRGIFCGILMYLAVSAYREKNTLAGILLCVPTFILSGFEHSIADMFYFAASGIVAVRAFLFIWLVIYSNALGAVLPPLLMHLAGEGGASSRQSMNKKNDK